MVKKLIKNILGKMYGLKLKEIGKNVYIGLHTKIVNGKNIVLKQNVSIMPYNMLVSHGDGKIIIRENSEIGMFSRIAAVSKVEIEENVITGPNIFIADYNHKYTDIRKPIKDQGAQTKGDKPQIYIGADTWIGTNVSIVGTVSIGKHCVIGANSVVTRDIPAFSVVAGNPAKIIKRYDENISEWVVVK